MIYYLVPIIIIFCSLVTIIFIVLKKFPSLAAINIESIVTERDSKAKNRIIVERLARRFLDLKKTIFRFFEPLAEKISSGFSDFYQGMINLEKKRIKQTNPLKSIDINQEVKDKLIKAQTLFDQDKIDEAEDSYIKIISLDRNNSEAYEGLTKIYLANRDYKKARQTCRYNLKLLIKSAKNDTNGTKHQLACCYAQLGEIYQLENKLNYALNHFQKAIELEPSNPRFLDLLLKISIIVKRKDLALGAFKALKKTDPENQKLDELKQEIDKITVNN